MAYIQKLQFNPAKMGKKPGWCLQNCRLGFGIGKGTFASAKLDMESQRKNGTLHSGLPPKDISCPIYCDTKATAEHVGVWHKGTNELLELDAAMLFECFAYQFGGQLGLHVLAGYLLKGELVSRIVPLAEALHIYVLTRINLVVDVLRCKRVPLFYIAVFKLMPDRIRPWNDPGQD